MIEAASPVLGNFSMTITVNWDDDEHTIVRLASQDTWGMEEFRQACLQSMALLRTVEHPVYVLCALYLGFNLPHGILWELRDIIQISPPNWSGGIIITQDSFAVSLVVTLSQVYMRRKNHRLVAVANEAEAYRAIAKFKQQDQG